MLLEAIVRFAEKDSDARMLISEIHTFQVKQDPDSQNKLKIAKLLLADLYLEMVQEIEKNHFKVVTYVHSSRKGTVDKYVKPYLGKCNRQLDHYGSSIDSDKRELTYWDITSEAVVYLELENIKDCQSLLNYACYRIIYRVKEQRELRSDYLKYFAYSLFTRRDPSLNYQFPSLGARLSIDDMMPVYRMAQFDEEVIFFKAVRIIISELNHCEKMHIYPEIIKSYQLMYKLVELENEIFEGCINLTGLKPLVYNRDIYEKSRNNLKSQQDSAARGQLVNAASSQFLNSILEISNEFKYDSYDKTQADAIRCEFYRILLLLLKDRDNDFQLLYDFEVYLSASDTTGFIFAEPTRLKLIKYKNSSSDIFSAAYIRLITAAIELRNQLLNIGGLKSKPWGYAAIIEKARLNFMENTNTSSSSSSSGKPIILSNIFPPASFDYEENLTEEKTYELSSLTPD